MKLLAVHVGDTVTCKLGNLQETGRIQFMHPGRRYESGYDESPTIVLESGQGWAQHWVVSVIPVS